jgi:hypothetical protein
MYQTYYLRVPRVIVQSGVVDPDPKVFASSDHGCGTGKFEDCSGSDILSEYGSSSGSGSCTYIYIYEYVYIYV